MPVALPCLSRLLRLPRPIRGRMLKALHRVLPLPPGSCNCSCSAEHMTSAQQGKVVTAYLCLLMFVMVSPVWCGERGRGTANVALTRVCRGRVPRSDLFRVHDIRRLGVRTGRLGSLP